MRKKANTGDGQLLNRQPSIPCFKLNIRYPVNLNLKPSAYPQLTTLTGFPSINAFIIYLVGNTVLMLSYWIIWMLYFNKQTYREQMALAVIPTGIFLLSGITMLHYFLIIFAVIFGIGHIYVTSRNKVC